MSPVNRVRPPDDIVADIHRRVKAGHIKISEIARQYGVNRKTVYRWFVPDETQPRYRHQIDPEGFDQACLLVAEGKLGLCQTAQDWQCACSRVRKRVLELTGQPHKRYKRVLNVEQPAKKTSRQEMESMKRARLRRELQAMLEQPYRVAA